MRNVYLQDERGNPLDLNALSAQKLNKLRSQLSEPYYGERLYDSNSERAIAMGDAIGAIDAAMNSKRDARPPRKTALDRLTTDLLSKGLRQSNPTANRINAVDYIVRHNPFKASALSGQYTHSTETGRLHRAAADAFRAAQRQAGGDGLYVVYSYHTPIAWWSSGAGWTVLGKNDLSGSPTTSGHIRVVQNAVVRNSNPGHRGGARRLHRAGNPINERGEFYKGADEPFIEPDFYLMGWDVGGFLTDKPKGMSECYGVWLVDLRRHVYIASMTPSIEGELMYYSCEHDSDALPENERQYDKAMEKIADYLIELEQEEVMNNHGVEYFNASDVRRVVGKPNRSHKVELDADTLEELRNGEITYEEVVEDLREYYRGNQYL
jgi:hypothetical protein